MKKARYKRQKKEGISSSSYMALLFLFTSFIILSLVMVLLGLLRVLTDQQTEGLYFLAYGLLAIFGAIWVRRKTTEKKVMTEREAIEEDISLILGLRNQLLWGGAFAALPAIILTFAVVTDPKAIDSIIAWIIVISAIVATSSITCAFKIYQFKRKAVIFGYLFSVIYMFNLPIGPILAISTIRQTRKVSHLFKN